MSKFNALIVDDHPIMLDGIRNILLELNITNQIFTAIDGKKAIEILKNNEIDFLITDISMPGVSGVELAKFVKQNYKKIKILILSQFDDIQVIKPLIKINVDGFLIKSQDKETVKLAIMKIAEGGKFYSDEINQLIIKILQNNTEDENQGLISLSKRETEVLKLIADEKTNKDIADILFISVPTVETYRRILFKKFNIKNSVGLIKKAIEMGFVS